MDNDIIYKLKNTENLDLTTLNQRIQNGAKFIIFNYRIGLGVLNLLRFSPAIFVNNNKELNLYKSRYNKYNMILGPWSIFKGPFLTYDIYKSNNRNGIDVTKDIMINIDEQALYTNEVSLKKVYTIFHQITDKNDLKTFTQSFKEINRNLVPLKSIYIATYINVDQYTEPYLTIGVDLLDNRELDIQHIEECLYKYFMKHVYFEIIDLRDQIDVSEKLIEQGTLIYPFNIQNRIK